MTRSRVGRVAVVAALLGSAGWGWHVGGAAPTGFPAIVVRALDGDTIEVIVGSGRSARSETVRMLGVDTPETHHPRKPVECFGPEAAAYTAGRLRPGDRVRLEQDVERRDRYGRLLAHVVVDGRRFGDELLRLGYARLLVIPPNGRHARSMLGAELAARAERRGRWGACGPGG